MITFSFIDLLSYDSLSEGDEQEDSVEGGEKGRDDRVENPKKRHASESAMSATSGELAFFFNLEIIPHLIEPCHSLYDAVVQFDMPARMSVSPATNWYFTGSGQLFEANLECVVSKSGNCRHLGGNSSHLEKNRWHLLPAVTRGSFTAYNKLICQQPVSVRARAMARARTDARALTPSDST